jgi:hypothetical protein
MVLCKIPNSDNPLIQLNYCIKIIRELDFEIEKFKIAELDLSCLEWMSPFSSLILSSKIYDIYSNFKSKLNIVAPTKIAVKEYLDKIGFPLGKIYLDGTSVSIRHFNKNPIKECIPLFDFIDQTFPQTLRGNCIKYIISELVDNIEQHSDFTTASIMAQYYPKKNMVDIGVIDNGITIPYLLEINNLGGIDDCNRILSAINGISTKKEIGRGYGLSSSTKITIDGLDGECYIVSRRGIVHLKANGFRKLYKLENNVYNGTIIYMRFLAPKKSINITSYLEK